MSVGCGEVFKGYRLPIGGTTGRVPSPWLQHFCKRAIILCRRSSPSTFQSLGRATRIEYVNHSLSPIQSTADNPSRFYTLVPQASTRRESSLQCVVFILNYTSKISRLVCSEVLQCRARVGAVFCVFLSCLARSICRRRRRARNPFACTKCGDGRPLTRPTRTSRSEIKRSRSPSCRDCS